MSHYLITGGCGFIGSHLCDALLKAGHRVRVIDNLSSGTRENLSPNAELIIGDIRDKTLMQKAVANIDGCFHLAAIASVTQSQEQWRETHSVNLTGAIILFEAVRPRGIPVIYASSAAVYGDNPNMPLSEQSRTEPLAPYGADKLGCELHARAGGIPSIGFRFFNVYGPRQNPDSPYSGVISIFIDRCRAGKPITIFGDGEQVRDFIYVQDAVDCMITGMQKITPQTRHIMNVCTGQGTTINQLAEIIAQATGHNVPRNNMPARAGDIRISIGSNKKLKTVLGFAPSTTLAQGIALTLGF